MPKKRSISATVEGLIRLNNAMDCKINSNGGPFSDNQIQDEAGVSSKTLSRCLKGVLIDRSSMQEIVNFLGLNLLDIVDPDEWNNLVTPIYDWCEVCTKMLKSQRRITSNPLMQDESGKKAREQIYVPLALVEKRKTDKRNKEHFFADAGTRLYEPEYETQQRFEHKDFLIQILERGEGKTKGQQIAIIGEPGAGKTTLLQTIAFWILEKKLGLPIWVSLADLGKNGTLTDIKTYICNSWLEEAFALTELTQEIRDDFKYQIQKGKVWLLLDGVDEISEGSAFHQPLEEISRQLTGLFGGSLRVVLTCRLNVWQAGRNALETFETYRLLNFDYPQQVHQFIDKFFVEEIEKGERLKTELDSSERVRWQDMVRTPLRLVLLCGIWQSEEGNLPETKAGLYDQYARYLYQWKQYCFRINIEEQQELNLALGRLALRDFNENSSRFRLRESFIIQELGYRDDETSLFYKAFKLGYLNDVGIAAESPSKEKVYAYWHPTFEEYYASLAVDDRRYFLNHVPENPKQGTYRIFEPQWKEVILLWLGREDIKEQEKEEFIKALVEFKDGCNSQSPIPDWKGFYEYRTYFLAAAGIAEFKNCSLADEIVKQIVTWSFCYFNIQTQDCKIFAYWLGEKARAVLLETDRQKAATALKELIRDSQDKYTCELAACILSKIAPNNPTAINALIKLIRDPEDRYPSLSMEQSLSKIAPNIPTLINPLEELIGDSQDELTRFRAACMLIAIAPNNPTAINALIKLISDTQDKNIHHIAALSLKKISPDDPTAINTLIKLIRDSQDEGTRWYAAYFLEKIARNNLTAINALVELIHDSQDEFTRCLAAYFLRKIALYNPTSITALVELIRDFQDEDTRWQAADSLGNIAPNNPTTIKECVELISDTQDESTRWRAAYILGEIVQDNPTTITELEELIHDTQDEDTRLLAAYILGEISPDHPTAINALIKLIRDSQDKYTCELAAYILSKIAPNNLTAITALVGLICDTQNNDTCLLAADIFGKIVPNNPTAINALIKLIRDSQDEGTRLLVGFLLMKIPPNNPTAINALVEFIPDSQDPYIGRQAAGSLGKIALYNPTSITALVELIRDFQDEFTRLLAADTLGRISPNNPTAITELMQLIRDSQDEFTRLRAAYSLGRTSPNNPTAINALIKLIRDSQDESMRLQAANGLRDFLTESKEMTPVVTALKNHLSSETCEFIWHCTQTMTYLAFFQAWHQEL
jgi:HEAT repeat protein